MLNFQSISLYSADLPKTSLIPDMRDEKSLPFFVLDESVPKNHGLYIGQGMVPSVLPYTVQSSYARDFKNRTYKAAILENEYLRATFLPELGGRLWSLYDKRLCKELLYQNKVIAFANLALRNAWFAGGVEWNIGVRGHTHFTCSPIFACREVNTNGEEILKMYEYEAIRGLTYVIRAGLYKDSLRINITVENTRNEPTYLYWWSNIAIPQTNETRVLVPTNKSYVTTYQDGGYVISHTDILAIDEKDITYPKNTTEAKDYFFDIPNGNKKWIAAIEGDGIGLLQSSSEELIGRKLFVWGNTEGGKHWNDWLTDGEEYAEIQAGLAKTQFEHLPMEPKQIVSWNECYRAVTLKNKDDDFDKVCGEIEKSVDECDFGSFFDIKFCSKPVICGSGRGALASMLDKNEAPTICTFTETDLTAANEYFVSLINKTAMPKNPIISYAIDSRYLQLIDEKIDKTDYDYYMSGVIAYANGMLDRAKSDFLNVKGEYEWLALSCLAQLEVNLDGDFQKGYEFIKHAIKLKKNDISLLILFGEISIKAEQYGEFIAESEGVSNGRVQMYRAKCLVETDRLDEACVLLSPKLVIPDIREGEYSISAIWCELYRRIIARDEWRLTETITEDEVLQKYPIPYSLDFRMH